jgi:hypothetical protein
LQSSSAAVLIGLLAFAPACVGQGAQQDVASATRFAPATAFPNDQTAYDYFRTQGFTTFQAAAIVGNLDLESGLDPTIAQQGGGPGRGIAQWSAGGRWDTDAGDNLVAFAAQKGKSPTALDVQLDFIVYELDMFPAYGLAKLQATTNVTDATTDFELDFEGCAIASECDLSARISYAQDVLAAYAGDPVNSDGGSTAADAGATAGLDLAGASRDAAGSSGDAAAARDGGAAAARAGGGCAVAAAGAAGGAPATWTVAIGLALGIASRRRRHARRSAVQ